MTGPTEPRIGCARGARDAHPALPPAADRVGRRAPRAGAARQPGPVAVRLSRPASRPSGPPRRAAGGAVVRETPRRRAPTRCCPPRSRGCARRSGPGGCRAAASCRWRCRRRPGSIGRWRSTVCARRTPLSGTDAGGPRGTPPGRRWTIADGGLLPGLEARWIDEKRAELADLRLELLEIVAASGDPARRRRAAARRTGRPRRRRSGAVPRVRSRRADRGAARARQRRRRPARLRGRPHAAARGARRDAWPAAARAAPAAAAVRAGAAPARPGAARPPGGGAGDAARRPARAARPLAGGAPPRPRGRDARSSW